MRREREVISPTQCATAAILATQFSKVKPHRAARHARQCQSTTKRNLELLRLLGSVRGHAIAPRAPRLLERRMCVHPVKVMPARAARDGGSCCGGDCGSGWLSGWREGAVIKIFRADGDDVTARIDELRSGGYRASTRLMQMRQREGRAGPSRGRTHEGATTRKAFINEAAAEAAAGGVPRAGIPGRRVRSTFG